MYNIYSTVLILAKDDEHCPVIFDTIDTMVKITELNVTTSDIHQYSFIY